MKDIICTRQITRPGFVEIHGIYNDTHVTKDDIVEYYGNGDYGNRFVFFDAGTFIYIKYVDQESVYEE
jgi:hypothetical protein